MSAVVVNTGAAAIAGFAEIDVFPRTKAAWDSPFAFARSFSLGFDSFLETLRSAVSACPP
jgi:hypothetical protein